MDKLNINQWAEEDRPREKMERLGAEALSDAELLAILVGSGSPQEDAVSLMKRILSDCNNNLNTLGKMTLRQLCEYNGVGPAKAITILAACELGKRRNQNNRLIKKVRISHGGITEVSVDIRIIMREAVLANATIIAVCHNHPSGNLRPSTADNDLTNQLQRACQLMRIHFMDHVILTDGNYFSYRETGRL